MSARRIQSMARGNIARAQYKTMQAEQRYTCILIYTYISRFDSVHVKSDVFWSVSYTVLFLNIYISITYYLHFCLSMYVHRVVDALRNLVSELSRPELRGGGAAGGKLRLSQVKWREI